MLPPCRDIAISHSESFQITEVDASGIVEAIDVNKDVVHWGEMIDAADGVLDKLL